jgi:hypothetical protein
MSKFPLHNPSNLNCHLTLFLLLSKVVYNYFTHFQKSQLYCYKFEKIAYLRFHKIPIFKVNPLWLKMSKFPIHNPSKLNCHLMLFLLLPDAVYSFFTHFQKPQLYQCKFEKIAYLRFHKVLILKVNPFYSKCPNIPSAMLRCSTVTWHCFYFYLMLSIVCLHISKSPNSIFEHCIIWDRWLGIQQSLFKLLICIKWSNITSLMYKKYSWLIV